MIFLDLQILYQSNGQLEQSKAILDQLCFKFYSKNCQILQFDVKHVLRILAYQAKN